MKSDHFSFRELIYSETATRENIDNIPDFHAVQNLLLLTARLLNPLRAYMGCPIYINSGYRSGLLNKRIGGANTSQHLFGKAVDITCRDRKTNKVMADYIRYNMDFDQLIIYNNFIHVSYNERANRREIIIK